MTEHLDLTGGTLAYDVDGEGPLVVLAHGMGDSRHSYRFLAPALVAAGYRVANVDLRGSGDSSLGWDGYSRTDIAGDLVAVVRHLGGPAVIIGQSISGGAATIAAATAPDVISGVIELAPFTRKQSVSVGGLLSNKRYRVGSLRLARWQCWAAGRRGRSTSTWPTRPSPPTGPPSWSGSTPSWPSPAG